MVVVCLGVDKMLATFCRSRTIIGIVQYLLYVPYILYQNLIRQKSAIIIVTEWCFVDKLSIIIDMI